MYVTIQDLGQYYLDPAKPTFLSDAANVLAHGANLLWLYEGGAVISSFTATASCASGSTWNGSICVTTAVPPIEPTAFDVSDCVIEVGKSTCRAAVSVTAPAGLNFYVGNTTRSITTSNLIMSSMYNANTGKYYLDPTSYTPLSDASNFLKFGANTITLMWDNVVKFTDIASATCAVGTTWNGSICATNVVAPPASPAPTPVPSTTGGGSCLYGKTWTGYSCVMTTLPIDLPELVSVSSCVKLTVSMKEGSRDGNSSSQVSELQYYLNKAKYLRNDPTGFFGPATQNAVKSFQRRNQIYPNGVVGAYTRAKIAELSCSTVL
jgi:hypothetical protein